MCDFAQARISIRSLPQGYMYPYKRRTCTDPNPRTLDHDSVDFTSLIRDFSAHIKSVDKEKKRPQHCNK